MNKKLYLLPFLVFALNAQDADPAPVVEPVITDLDLLVESVKTTASILSLIHISEPTRPY